MISHSRMKSSNTSIQTSTAKGSNEISYGPVLNLRITVDLGDGRVMRLTRSYMALSC
jgi:hypothetical protein